MAGEGLPVQVSGRVLGVSESGYYERRKRPPSARAVRHDLLIDLVKGVHAASRGIYGARRVLAELVLGHGVAVGHGQVELLMRRAGCKASPAGRNGDAPNRTRLPMTRSSGSSHVPSPTSSR